MSQQQSTTVLGRHFADFLKKRRGQRNESQAEFARFLGIKHQQTYQAYEAGRVPDGETLYEIATKLEVSIEEMLTGKPAVFDETQFVIILSVLCEEVDWRALVSAMKRITDNPKVTEDNKRLWVRLLGDWALGKLPPPDNQS